MENKKIAEEAFNYFNSGYNCAEAVLKSITDNFSSEKNEAILRIASPFCGGIGKTTKEICGALSGGIMAIGYLYGRSKPGENFDAAWKMTAKLRTEFEEKWGTTQCGSILKE
ncbi:C-GCAxxG-C-C family protein, partial [bacterium]|nr:C-GCAxxG-C-C family protein [bacterium]